MSSWPTTTPVERVARDDDRLVPRIAKRLDSALDLIQPTVIAVARQLDALKGPKVRQPRAVEVQFGVRLNAEVGAVIAKTQTEAHFMVTLTWDRT